MGEKTMDDLDYTLPANCPSPYFDTWDRHNSIAFSATKGLRNAPGENNCFVNCAVQVFWHLDVFRRSYRRLLGHTCMGNSCIFCALKVIFTQFQYSDKTSLHPDALRKALAETFANQQRFQLGHMDDAAECFENILRRIHFHIACGQNEDACTAPHCLPHQKFSMAVYEKVVCFCGASSSPLKFSEMVHYVSASALVAQSRMMQESGDALHPDRFGLLLRKASAMGDVRDCPANCGKQVQKQRTLLNIPDVVSVGLVWDSDHPSVEMTTEVAGALGTAILLQDMYHRVMPDVRKLPRLQLVAVVCYYGKHYSTFVFHSKLKTWVYFDDATVREIGPQWENVVEKCSRGRFQPLLLLYANPSATPVSVDTAPRKRVMAPGYTTVGMPEDGDSGLDRTHESIKSMAQAAKRSTTPNPDHLTASSNSHPPGAVNPGADLCSQDSGRDSPARLTREHSRQSSFLFAVTGKNDNRMGEGGEGGSHLPGGAGHHHPSNRRQLLDGGAVRLETMAEDAGDYADYTLSGGNQYRRPSLNGVDSANQLPMPPNMARYSDSPRKDSFTKQGAVKEKRGVDVVRYQVDPGRGASRTPDFTGQRPQGEGFSPQKGDKVSHMKPPVHHGRQRSLSSGRDEEGLDTLCGSQHVVVKPKPTGHGNYDTVDGTAHTPVQSGLATLPRHKGQTHTSDSAAHQRHGSTHQEVAQLTRKSNAQCTAVAPPLPPGTPPPEYNAVLEPHPAHSRQTSASSQASSMKSSVSMGHIDQVVSGKKSDGEKSKKKVKKEKKSEKDAAKKSDKKKSKSDSALRKSESESDLSADKSNKYIDRRMVESILKHQGVHRQNSSCSNNSISSVESDSLMGKLLASKAASGNLTVDIPYDNMSLGSQKDSGYGSSDRNSSSSTGSGTIDPYTQYFISKSMVVPRSVNTQHLMEEQTTQYNKIPSDPYGGQQTTAQAGSNRDDGRKIMHPIKESSQEDMLRLSPNEPIGTQKFIMAPAAVSDARPPPVPPKNFAQFQIIKSASHERESSLDSLDKDESINGHFVSMCKKADALMDSCVLAETGNDLSSALTYCESALGCLKEAMIQKDLNSKVLAYVERKHNSCLLKLRSLQKRAPALRQESHSSGIGSDAASSVGNRSSITSSDSDMSDQFSKQLRLDSKARPPQHRPHPSPDSLSSRSVHERQNSASRQGQLMDNKNGYYDNAMMGSQKIVSHNPQDSGSSHHRTDSNSTSRMPQSHSANYFQGSNSSGSDSGVNSADLYGTLPRNKSRKPTSDAPASAEVYQSFLNKQKCLQAGVTASQHSLDSVKSDSGSDHSTSSSSQKINKAEIRQLLQDKFVQRQQPGVPQQHSAQQWQQQQDFRQSGQQLTKSTQPSGMPQRSAHNYGQTVHKSSAGHPAWQQQQHSTHPQQHPLHPHLQQQQQQHPPPPHHHQTPSYQQHAQYQQQRQSQQTGLQNSTPMPPPPTALQQPSPPQGHDLHSTQMVGARTAPPPVPGQKPSIPYPSSVARARAPTDQAAAFLPRPDTTEVGRRVAPQNVARVMPNSHMSASQLGNGGNYLVMMPPSSQQQTTAPSIPLGSQIRHTTSGLRLSGPPLPSGSKPLERCASQPDCQKLVDSAYPANLSDLSSSSYSGGRSLLSASPLPFAPSNEQLRSPEGSVDSQRPSSTSDNTNCEADSTAISVRALASRFEKTDAVMGQAASPGSHPCSRQTGQKSDRRHRPHGPVTVQRTRSKSESFSRKPKSVLKNKKNKGRPRKSVTFADSIGDYANCDDVNSGYESARETSTPRVKMDNRAYYSDDEERLESSHVSYSDNDLDDVEDTGSSNSDESPLGEEDTCQLCNKRRNEPGKQFCSKCSFYMDKLKSS